MREETGREQTQGQGLSIPPWSVNSNFCGIWSGKYSETIRTGGAYGILGNTCLPPFFSFKHCAAQKKTGLQVKFGCSSLFTTISFKETHPDASFQKLNLFYGDHWKLPSL